MSSRALFAAIFLAGVAVLGWTYWSTLPEPASEAAGDLAELDVSNSYLAIEVDGEAKGVMRIELFDNVAPGHVERIKALAASGTYDGVVFHRVIDGFMAQTGDVEFGRLGEDLGRAGMGGSDMPDLKAEFSDIPFERGMVGMARSNNPDSANSQFFIMFAPAPHLNGAYTIVGEVIEGLEVLDQIKRGKGGNGAVLGKPDVMVSVRVED